MAEPQEGLVSTCFVNSRVFACFCVQHNTMESLLERGEKLDDLVSKSEVLGTQSKAFYKTVSAVVLRALATALVPRMFSDVWGEQTGWPRPDSSAGSLRRQGSRHGQRPAPPTPPLRLLSPHPGLCTFLLLAEW